MAAPKIDPFQDGEAQPLTDEIAAQEAGETEALETQQADTASGTEAAPVEGQQQGKEPGPIPYPRFKEVNEAKSAAERRATEAEKERNELRERWARLDERRNQLTEAQQNAARQAEVARKAAERPDPAFDPTGAELFDVKQRAERLEANFAALQNQYQQGMNGVQQNQQHTEFNNWVQFQANSYAAQDPKYFEKAQRAVAWRESVWMSTGMTPERARERVAQESMLIAAECRQNGVNFAPIIAELSDVLDIMQQRRNGNGGGTAANGQNTNAQKLQQIQAGQRVQGLSHLPGNAGDNGGNYRTYTPAQIASMTEAEFSRAKNNPRAWADLQYAMAIAEGIEPSEMGRM